MQNGEKYWVFDWLDRHRVSSIDAVRLLLRNPVAFDDLRRAAEAAVKQFGKAISPGESVLAGRGIDLLGPTGLFCPKLEKAAGPTSVQ